MKVYDFDKTIYNGDSTFDFYIFCIKKQPLLLLLLPVQGMGFVLYKLSIYRKVQFKEKFYIFVKYLKNREQVLAQFWHVHKQKIQPWYIQQQQQEDCIISASPHFLLEPICKDLGIQHLIASEVDFASGKCLSENCYGEEKVIRFKQQFSDAKVAQFYSDSLTDAPMAKLAHESFGVIGDEVITWSALEQMPKQPSMLKEFLLFLIVGVINTFNGVVFATIFALFLDGTIAFLLGYACSLVISYFLNSRYVFKQSLSFERFWKFCVSYIPNFSVQLVCVVLLLNLLHWPEFIVYTISAIIGVPITFLMVKFFALKK